MDWFNPPVPSGFDSAGGNIPAPKSRDFFQAEQGNFLAQQGANRRRTGALEAELRSLIGPGKRDVSAQKML
jgi:hypothetical protein